MKENLYKQHDVIKSNNERLFIPYRCPVCNGVGQVPNGFYSFGIGSTTSATPEDCRTCMKTAIVWG